MTHLVQKDGHLLLVDAIHEVLSPHPLSPITASTATEAVCQPETLIVVPRLATRAFAVVSILVEEAPTSGSTLWCASRVRAGVDIDTLGRALEEALVADSPSDDANVDVAEREVIEAVEPFKPELVLLGGFGGDLVPLGLSHGCVGFPADTHLDRPALSDSFPLLVILRNDLPLSSHYLVPAIVGEAVKSSRVGIQLVLPNLLKRSAQLAGRTPSILPLEWAVVWAKGSWRSIGEEFPDGGIAVSDRSVQRHCRASKGGQGEKSRLHIEGYWEKKRRYAQILKWKGSYVLSGQLWEVEEVFGSQRTEAFYKIPTYGGNLRGAFDNTTTMEFDVSFP